MCLYTRLITDCKQWCNSKQCWVRWLIHVCCLASDVTRCCLASDVTLRCLACDVTRHCLASDVTRHCLASDVTRRCLASYVTRHWLAAVTSYATVWHMTSHIIVLLIEFLSSAELCCSQLFPRSIDEHKHLNSLTHVLDGVNFLHLLFLR